ncbi:MAG: HEAT repeat domain-containing protein [Polyangiaceae bacterium]
MDDSAGTISGEDTASADKAPPQRNVEAPVVVIACPLPDGDSESDFQVRARYINGVEHIARAWGAVSPTVWDGDRAWLSFANGPHERRALQAYRAAQELLVRGALALELPVRVAVTITAVGADGRPSIEGGDLLTMLSRAPEKRLIATEDFVFCLPSERRFEFGPAAAAEADTVFHVAAPGAIPRRCDDLDPRALWDGFEQVALSPEVREVRYVGFRLPKRAPPVLDLLDVFVPPNTTWVERGWEGAVSGEDAEELAHMYPLVNRAGSPLRYAFWGGEHLVFLGEPGSGKTTLLRWLALVAASGEWPALRSEVRPCLPLLISVGRLAEVLRETSKSGVEALASYYVPATTPGAEVVARFLDRQLRLGRCLVLFDGLDEVRAADRARTEEWLRAFAERYSKSRFVTTSRFVGYSGLRLPEDAGVRRLTALDQEGRSAFVHAFCRAYLKWETGRDRPADAEVQATALLEAIEANDRLSALAQNPFMLSALALIHRAEGRLPRHRVQAYQMFLRALCETWGEARRLVPEGSLSDERKVVLYEEEAIPVLGDLALALHERYPRGVAPTEVVRKSIAQALQGREEIDEEAALGLADAFLKRAGEEVQILLERGRGQWGFLHLTFQEMFVAAGLHSTERFEEVALSHLLSPRWEEVIRLGVGYLALVQARPVAAKRFLEKVLAYRAPEPGTRAEEILGKHIGIAALLAMEAGEALPPSFQRRIAEEFARWYCEGPPQDLGQHGLFHKPIEALDSWLRQMGLSDFSAPLIDALQRRLLSPEAHERWMAARALEKLRAHVPMSHIVESMSLDEEPRPWIFKALLTSDATSSDLLEMAVHPSAGVRAAAVMAAESLSTEDRAAVLRKVEGDPSPLVREISARLPMAGARRPGGVYLPEELTAEEELRLAPFLHDASPEVREMALDRLHSSKIPAVLDAEEAVLRSDPSQSARRQAAINLAKNGAESGFALAFAAFAENVDEPIWSDWRRWLFGSQNLDSLLSHVLAQATSADSKTRATAAFLLGHSGTNGNLDGHARREEVESALIGCLRDSDPRVRREALHRLDASFDRACTVALDALLDPNPEVRQAAYESMVRSGRIPKDRFIAGLDDEVAAVRAICLSVLRYLPENERSARLAKAAEDPDPRVRRALPDHLDLATEEGEALLVRLLGDASYDVRSSAVTALWNRIQNRGEPRMPVEAVARLLDSDPPLYFAAMVLARAGASGLRALLDHADKSVARVGLWLWAEASAWSFGEPSVVEPT